MIKHHYRRVHRFPPGYPRVLDLQTSLWMAAHWTWERRATSKAARMAFGEESITETILLDLATQHPRDIKIFPFNKRQEGKVGADWEWCFFDARRSKFQPMLVQAKLLDDKDEEYTHLDRMIGSTGVRQIDRLVETSGRRNVPAVFAFYNHLNDLGRTPNVCGSFDCDECWGCSIALAEAVRAGLPKKDFDSIKRHSKPWVCLLCHGLSARDDVASRVLATLQDLFRRSEAIFREAKIPFENAMRPPENPSNEPPRYFMELMSAAESESAEERDAMIREVAAQNPDIDGIILATDTAHEEH